MSRTNQPPQVRRLAAATTLASATLLAAPVASGAENGIDVLRADNFAALAGLRVGLVTNHTGIARDGTTTIDLLHRAPSVELVALFGPEHGIRGTEDTAEIADSRDAATGLPVYSLYHGQTRKPSPEHLAGLDALVFDIQDIGTRFYTYISTLGLCMEVAADSGVKRFFVLDRVNPIGGLLVDGPLRYGPRQFVAHHEIPLIHGMTAGELAQMFRAENRIEIDLTVVPVRGWERAQRFDATGLPWVNPSPNMRSLAAALLYPGVGLLEFTNLSVGRGTPAPFEVIGAPYITDPNRFAQKLNDAKLPGLRFEAVTFTPDASVFAGERCGGARIAVTDPDALRALDLGLVLAATLLSDYGGAFDPKNLNRLLLHPHTETRLLAGATVAEVRKTWEPGLQAFRERRSKFLIYQE
jgi:uncharacterized protein YbbC (DUF1343 family)